MQLTPPQITSLRLRLAAGAGLAIVAALTLSGVFLNRLFERYVERRVESELSVYVKQLAAVVEITGRDRAGLIAPLADPHFQRPLSGLYWQVESESGVLLLSRSLVEQPLPSPPFKAVSATTRSAPEGPDGETLLAVSRVVFLRGPSGGDVALRLTAAQDQAEIRQAQRAFAFELFVAFALLALALLSASTAQILVGLSPLRVLKRKVNAIRTGEAARLTGDYPIEVRLLVDEMNALLDANDKIVDRARDGAADLAHGLKTPLAVLLAESRKLGAQGHDSAAAEIVEQAQSIAACEEDDDVSMPLFPAGPPSTPGGLTAIQAAMISDILDWARTEVLGVLRTIDSDSPQQKGTESSKQPVKLTRENLMRLQAVPEQISRYLKRIADPVEE